MGDRFFRAKGLGMSNLQVYKSNDLMTASYRLSVAESRIILTCIAKINRDPTQTVTDAVMYSFTAREFAELSGISLMAAYSELKEAIDQLFDRRIRFHMKDRERKTRWIQTADYIDGEGRVELRFSKDVLPYLVNLQGNFTKYNLKAVARLSSAHAIRLYELIVKNRYSGFKTLISIDLIRFGLNLDDAYPLYADLRKRVIEPAIKQISEHSDITIHGFEPKREGRKIAAIEISFSDKQGFGGEPIQEDLLPAEDKPKYSRSPRKSPKVKDTYSEAEIMKAARPGESKADVIQRLKNEAVRKAG